MRIIVKTFLVYCVATSLVYANDAKKLVEKYVELKPSQGQLGVLLFKSDQQLKDYSQHFKTTFDFETVAGAYYLEYAAIAKDTIVSDSENKIDKTTIITISSEFLNYGGFITNYRNGIPREVKDWESKDNIIKIASTERSLDVIMQKPTKEFHAFYENTLKFYKDHYPNKSPKDDFGKCEQGYFCLYSDRVALSFRDVYASNFQLDLKLLNAMGFSNEIKAAFDEVSLHSCNFSHFDNKRMICSVYINPRSDVSDELFQKIIGQNYYAVFKKINS